MNKPKERINSAASVEKVINSTKELLNGGGPVGACHVSPGNVKLESIKNVSLPPVVTCGANCKECKNYCYAIKSYNRLPNVRAAWAGNYRLFLENPQQYFSDIINAAALERVFRWHVSGDIVNSEYFAGMILTARACPSCEFLAFTKQYNIVNAAIDGGALIPDNLNIIFSASPGVVMNNPHRLPECHINFENGALNTYNANNFNYTYHCGGNCRECVVNGCGCFFLKNGDAVVINQH
jgi:hypothetical protein